MPTPRRSWLVATLAGILAAALAVPAAAGPPVPPGRPVPSGAEVTWDAATCAATVHVVVSKAGPRVTSVVVDHDGTPEPWTAERPWLNGSAGEFVLGAVGDGPERTVTVTMHDRRGRVVSEMTVAGTCGGSEDDDGLIDPT
ncbi:MAG: hypothetical protein AB1Z55_05995 [Acidimicrobiia bacterium]